MKDRPGTMAILLTALWMLFIWAPVAAFVVWAVTTDRPVNPASYLFLLAAVAYAALVTSRAIRHFLEQRRRIGDLNDPEAAMRYLTELTERNRRIAEQLRDEGE